MNSSTYKSEEIGQLLRGIEATQDTIVETSQVFLKLGKEGFANRLSEDWIQYFKKFVGKENIQKRLAMLYLANDILQKCKMGSNHPKEFLEFFKPILIDAVKLVVDQRQDSLRDDFNKVFQIWRDRRVYPKDFLKELQTITARQERLEDTAEKAMKNVLPEGLAKIPTELLDFLEAEKDMKKWIDNEREARNKLDALLRDDYNFKEDEAKYQLESLKKSQELQHKYRTALLQKLSELLRLSDVEHMKLVHLLKKSTTLLDDLNR